MSKKNNHVIQLGERLRAIRTDLGMTQNALAKELGIPQTMVSKVERGDAVLSTTLMMVLCYYSGKINLNYLFDDNFDITNKDAIYNIHYSLNTIVKAKLTMMQDQYNRDIENVMQLL